MLDFAGPVEEITLRHVDSSKEYWDDRALHAVENLVEHCLARDYVPQARGCPFADKRVPVRLTAQLERGSSPTTFSEWLTVVIYILVQLSLKIEHHFGCSHQVLIGFLASAVVGNIGTSIVQWQIVFEAEQTLLSTEL